MRERPGSLGEGRAVIGLNQVLRAQRPTARHRADATVNMHVGAQAWFLALAEGGTAGASALPGR